MAIENHKGDRPSAPFRWGVIGAGQIAQIVLPLVAQRGMQVVAVHDLDPCLAQSLAQRFEGCAAVPALEDLLDRRDLDGIYLATPPFTHRELLLRCVEAWIPTICEKPFMLNAAEARQVATRTAARPEVAVACCSTRFRFATTVETLVERRREGLLGAIRRIRIFTTVPRPPPFAKLRPWKQTALGAGGGLVADWGVYEIEWIRGLLGELPALRAVEARLDYTDRSGTDIESGYEASMECENGLRIEVSRLPGDAPRPGVIELETSTESLRLPFTPGKVGEPHLCVERFPPGTTLEGAEGVVLSEPLTDWDRTLCGPLVDFAAAVTEGRRPAADATSQVSVHTVLDAILEAGRRQRQITLAPAS